MKTIKAFKTENNFTNYMRPQQIVDKKANAIIALLTFAFTLFIYWSTQNRSVTFWDVGEYITCCSILGIPHPPGNPFYIILGRLFAALGFNLPHALLINSMSGLFAALSVTFIYLSAVKLISMFEDDRVFVHIGAIIGALFAAFSFTFWNNAIEASVYPARDFVITLTLWLTLIWIEKNREYSHQNILLLIIYIFFLGFGIHQTALQTLPAVILLITYPIIANNLKTSKFWLMSTLYLGVGLALYFTFIYVGEKIHVPDTGKVVTGAFFFIITYLHLKDYISPKVWVWSVIFIIIALSTHIFLLVRSELRPFINEGHPHNIALFSDYVLRRQYGVTSFLKRRGTFLYQVYHHHLRYFSWQFFHADTIHTWTKAPTFIISVLSKAFVILFGLGGAYHQIRRNKHSFNYLFTFFFMTSIAMIFVINLSDAEVRDRDYFFTSFSIYSIWMGIGSIWLVRELATPLKKWSQYLLLSLLVLFPILNLASQYFIHNRSKELIALDYGLNFLNSLEENAILFTNGDNDTFPLWYAQAVKDPNAKEHIYPAKDIYPDADVQKRIARAVERKKKELKGIRPDVTIANFSLLNTPWYIRHLRDIEGVEFNIPDGGIDHLAPTRNIKDRDIVITSPNENDSFTVTIPKGMPLYTKDIAVIQIIRDNFGKRPIYFAVTTSDEVIFEKHIRNEGLVNRVVSTKGEDQVDLDRLLQNIEEVSQFRSIFDDRVYKDDNMTKLVTNYGASFLRISQYYHQNDDIHNAAIYLDRAITFLRNSERFYGGLINLYLEAKNYEAALSTIDRFLSKNPMYYELYLQKTLIYFESGNIDEAFNVFEDIITNNLKSPEVIDFVYSAAREYQQYGRGIELLKKMRDFDERHDVPGYIRALEKLIDKDSLTTIQPGSI